MTGEHPTEREWLEGLRPEDRDAAVTHSPAENQGIAKLQQTVEAVLDEFAIMASRPDLIYVADVEPGRAALRTLAAQASQGEDWKQLATEMGEALRNARHGGPKSEYIKVDAADANALLARLDGLAAGEQGA